MSSTPIRAAAVSLAAVTCVLGLTACHGSSGGAKKTGSTDSGSGSSGDTVAVQGYAFKPADLEVKTGTKVTWDFKDSTDHNVDVQSGPVKFKSKDLNTGKSFSYTFTKAGTYNYICSIHPYMTAKVVVK